MAQQSTEEESITNLINNKPELIKTIDDENVAKILMDDLYFPILKVLREGPKTVKELEHGYNKIAVNPKSDKTIYRYLKTLQDNGLVMQAGQRVVHGKTATETLFSRTAYGFFIRHDYSDFWKSEEGHRLSNAIGMLLSPLFGGKPNPDKLQEFFYDLSLRRIESLKKYLDQLDKNILEGISDLDWSKFTVFYNLGSFLAVFLEDPDLLKQLKECFD